MPSAQYLFSHLPSSIPSEIFSTYEGDFHDTVSVKLTKVSVKLTKNWNWQMMITSSKKKKCTYWWNSPAFGIEKNGPTYSEFEACQKFDFSSFKTQKFPAFFKNGRDFWDKKYFFGTLQFLHLKSEKKSIFWY